MPSTHFTDANADEEPRLPGSKMEDDGDMTQGDHKG